MITNPDYYKWKDVINSAYGLTGGFTLDPDYVYIGYTDMEISVGGYWNMGKLKFYVSKTSPEFVKVDIEIGKTTEGIDTWTVFFTHGLKDDFLWFCRKIKEETGGRLDIYHMPYDGASNCNRYRDIYAEYLNEGEKLIKAKEKTDMNTFDLGDIKMTCKLCARNKKNSSNGRYFNVPAATITKKTNYANEDVRLIVECPNCHRKTEIVYGQNHWTKLTKTELISEIEWYELFTRMDKFMEKLDMEQFNLMDNYVKKVIFNDPATIVYWADNTKTVVKAQDGEEFDPEKGLAMAISKKCSGNKHAYYNFFKKYLKKYDKDSK